MKLKKLLIILSLSTLACPCMASFALRGKSFKPEQKTQKREELKLEGRQVVQEAPAFTHEDVAEIVPTQFQENESTESVMSRILQNTANKIMKADAIAKSFLMKTAKKVEDSTKVDIAVKEQDRNVAAKEIEHKVKFDLQALKGQAKIVYTGLIDSKIEYQAANNTFQVSLEEQLSGNSKIALTHLNDRQQSLQLLQYQVNW